MLPRLQLYVFRQLLLALLFTVAGISFLIFPAVTVSAVHKLGGASVQALLLFIPLLAMELAPYLVPMGFLLSVVAVFGRLAADNEWTAIRMAGINPAVLLLPGLALSVGLSLGTSWVVNELVPQWKFDQRAHSRATSRSLLQSLNPGRTEIYLGDFYLNAAGRRDNTFYKVLVYLPRGEGKSDLKVLSLIHI